MEVFQRETVDAFKRILSHRSIPQIAIWRSDVTAEIDKWIKRKPEQGVQEVTNREKTFGLDSRSTRRTPYVAPRNEIERRIAELYQEFLGIESVSIHDNFFNLGGHSLLATQLIHRIRKIFQLEVPLRSFLDAPTIAELALMIEEMLLKELEDLTEEEAQELI
jgi:acyl carrier protein